MRNGWTEVALGEMMVKAEDTIQVKTDGVYPNLGIFGHGRGSFTKPAISGAATSAETLYRVKAGQFIYSRLFAFEGAYALVQSSQDGYFVSNEFPSFNVDHRHLLPGFLFAYFRLPSVWETLAGQSTGLGNRRQRIHPDILLAHKIPLPPLAVQQRIVAHLDAIESRLSRAQKLREEQEKELLAALRSSFHQLEAKAERVELSKVAPVHRRQIEISPEGKYPELGARSFGRGIFHKPTVRGDSLTWQKLFQVRAGDIVISNIKAWEGAIAVAGEADEGRYGSHRYLTCVADTQCVLPEYVCFYLLSPSGLEQVGLASPGSADRNRTLAVDRLEMIKIPIVPLATQREFKKLLDLQATVRAEAALSNQRLEALLPSLLDRLFNN